jgi:peptide/nickel transport system substrate-binding protein
MKGYPYDPEKAKQLLAEAGVKPGTRLELLAYNSARGYNPVGAEQAVAFQGYLQKVGIETDIKRVDVGAYLAAIRSGKYQGIFITGFTGDNGDPDNFVGTLFNPKRMPAGDTSHYSNPDVTKMMEEAAQVSDHQKRLDLYRTIQRQILDDAPWVFLNSTTQVRAIRKEVKGFLLNPTQMFFNMEQVSLQK